MGKRALVLGSLVLTFIIILIALGLYSYESSLEPLEVAEVMTSPTGTVDLALMAERSYLVPLQENTLSITVDATTSVASIEVSLAYDPEELEVISVDQGDFLSNTLSSPTTDNGLISFTYAAAPDSGGVTNSGTLALITVIPQKTVPTLNLEFETVEIAILEQDGNALRELMTQTPAARLRSDFNTDSSVNLYDYAYFVQDYGLEQEPIAGPADLNESGEVDLYDYAYFVQDYGQSI